MRTFSSLSANSQYSGIFNKLFPKQVTIDPSSADLPDMDPEGGSLLSQWFVTHAGETYREVAAKIEPLRESKHYVRDILGREDAEWVKVWKNQFLNLVGEYIQTKAEHGSGIKKQKNNFHVLILKKLDEAIDEFNSDLQKAKHQTSNTPVIPRSF